jgi:hypothetical protein
MNGKKIGLIVILISLLTMAWIVEDWKDAKVVAIMVGIFLLGTIARMKIR